MTYCDGYFPFCVREVAEDGEPFEAWDETTYLTTVIPAGFGPGGTRKIPSKSPATFVTVYGKHTQYPVGLTLDQISWLYWRVSHWDSGFQNMAEEVVPAATANGGSYSFVNDAWVWTATSAMNEDINFGFSDLFNFTKGSSKARVIRNSSPYFEHIETEPLDNHERLSCPGTLQWMKDTNTSGASATPIIALKANGSGGSEVSKLDTDVDSSDGCSVMSRLTFDASGGLGLRLSSGVLKVEDLYYPRMFGDSGFAFLGFGANTFGLLFKMEKSQELTETFVDGPPPGQKTETSGFSSRFSARCFFDGTEFTGGAVFSPSATVISVNLKFGPHDETFELGGWVSNLEPNTFTPQGTVTYLAQAKKYFTYGEIYNEDTGEPV